LLLDLYRCDRTERSKDLAQGLLGGFRRRLTNYRKGALIWDAGGGGPVDTSHADRMPYGAADAYEVGVVIERQQITLV
jgi:hypothetical protein